MTLLSQSRALFERDGALHGEDALKLIEALEAAIDVIRPFARVGEQIAKFIETTGEAPPVDSASFDFLQARAFLLKADAGKERT